MRAEEVPRRGTDAAMHLEAMLEERARHLPKTSFRFFIDDVSHAVNRTKTFAGNDYWMADDASSAFEAAKVSRQLAAIFSLSWGHMCTWATVGQVKKLIKTHRGSKFGDPWAT